MHSVPWPSTDPDYRRAGWTKRVDHATDADDVDSPQIRHGREPNRRRSVRWRAQGTRTRPGARPVDRPRPGGTGQIRNRTRSDVDSLSEISTVLIQVSAACPVFSKGLQTLAEEGQFPHLPPNSSLSSARDPRRRVGRNRQVRGRTKSTLAHPGSARALLLRQVSRNSGMW